MHLLTIIVSSKEGYPSNRYIGGKVVKDNADALLFFYKTFAFTVYWVATRPFCRLSSLGASANCVLSSVCKGAKEMIAQNKMRNNRFFYFPQKWILSRFCALYPPCEVFLRIMMGFRYASLKTTNNRFLNFKWLGVGEAVRGVPL